MNEQEDNYETLQFHAQKWSNITMEEDEVKKLKIMSLYRHFLR